MFHQRPHCSLLYAMRWQCRACGTNAALKSRIIAVVGHEIKVVVTVAVVVVVVGSVKLVKLVNLSAQPA
jgi:hypothetical protein